MTPIPGGARRRIFRSVAATIGMFASAGIAGLLLLDAFLRGGVEQGLLITPWVLLVLWGIYVFSYAPHVRTDAEGIRLHNVLSVIDIPWALVSAIRLRWQLEVTLHDGGVLRAFGGPSLRRPRKTPEEPEADAVEPSTRDLTLIQEAWIGAGESGSGESRPVRRTPDLAALVALAIIVAWTVASLVIVAPWS